MKEIKVKNYQNYTNDLKKSREQTLLIELNKKDLNSFTEEYEKDLNNLPEKKQSLAIAILTAKDIYDNYDESLKTKNTTNIIYIDTNKKNEGTNSLLLEQLVDQIDDSLKKLHNLEIAKEVIKGGLSYISSGLSNLFGNYVDKSLDLIVDSISDEIVEILGDTVIENSLDYGLDELKDRISSKINDTSINVLDKLKDTQLNLSEESSIRLLEDSKQINPNLSNAELYQLILKIITDIAINMPKAIFIKDPNKLDPNSIAIISLLLSVSKKLKDENKNIGVSVIYAYEDDDFQPYKECDEKYKFNQKLLDEQRLFAQRYAMLERPSSDIPFVAVKSHMFVGRIDELKILKDSYYNSKVNKKSLATMEVVAADPGVGKTKLVKKHFEQIRKEETNGEKLIQLELLNQVGHNSTNTGLASLIKSILEEAQRIDNLKTLSQKASDKIKDSAIDVTITTIKDILDNNLIDTSKAILDRYDLNEKIKDFSQIDIEKYKNENSKYEQFEKINSAIKTLEDSSDNSMPILLFIDDLQWLDETSSEYILNHFIKKFNVHIVCTLRASDATTMLSKAIESQSLNKYKIALLEKAGLFIDNKINSTINIDELLETSDTMQFNSNKFDLKGLDLNILTQLVSQVIEGDEEQQKTFSKSIIDTLTEDKSNVNTLFAIETINMLCDEKFYKDDIKLIIKNSIDSKIPMKFNPDIEDFIMFLNHSFKTLKSKYEESFNHPSNEIFTQNFNLMAYAVLEERLNILREYLSEYGNAAINTLLFSSILGVPFNSNIVKNIFENLSKLDEKENRYLNYLKSYIKEDNEKYTLDIEHYEIIDEVYEILSRYISFDNAYSYRHSLLRIFLEKQLEYVLDNKVFNILKNKELINAKDSLYKFIIEEINEEEKKQSFYGMEEQSLNLEDYDYLLFFKEIELNVLKKAYSNNSSNWTEKYIESLNNIAILYSHNKQITEAIKYSEEALLIVKKLYEINLSVWVNKYATNLNNLAFLYEKSNKVDKSIELFKDTVKITKELYIENSIEFTKIYVTSLNNLAFSYYRNNKFIEAINFQEETLEILKKLYVDNSNLWEEDYVRILNNLALSYTYSNKLDKAIKLYIEALGILKMLYIEDPSYWANFYTIILNNLALSYEKCNKLDKAIELNEEALIIRNALYEKNPTLWGNDFIINLNNLSSLYSKNNQIDESIQLSKMALKISKDFYSKNRNEWIEIYTAILNNLSYAYKEINKIDKALELDIEALEIRRKFYKKNPDIFRKDYCTSLNNLAISYVRTKEFDKASKYFEEYFKVFDFKSCSEIKYFIYPFVSWYQINLHTNKKIKELEEISNNLKNLFKYKLGNEYDNKIYLEYQNYKTLEDSSDNFDKEKFEIFEVFFNE